MCVSALGMKTLVNSRALEIMVVDKKGVKKPFDPQAILKIINTACEDLDSEKTELLYSKVEYSIFGGMSEEELAKLVINSAKYYSEFYEGFDSVEKKLQSIFNVSSEPATSSIPLPDSAGFAAVVKN